MGCPVWLGDFLIFMHFFPFLCHLAVELLFARAWRRPLPTWRLVLAQAENILQQLAREAEALHGGGAAQTAGGASVLLHSSCSSQTVTPEAWPCHPVSQQSPCVGQSVRRAAFAIPAVGPEFAFCYFLQSGM